MAAGHAAAMRSDTHHIQHACAGAGLTRFPTCCGPRQHHATALARVVPSQTHTEVNNEMTNNKCNETIRSAHGDMTSLTASGLHSATRSSPPTASPQTCESNENANDVQKRVGIPKRGHIHWRLTCLHADPPSLAEALLFCFFGSARQLRRGKRRRVPGCDMRTPSGNTSAVLQIGGRSGDPGTRSHLGFTSVESHPFLHTRLPGVCALILAYHRYE